MFSRGDGAVRSGVTCPVKPCLMISEVPWGTGPSSYSSLISGSYASITQLFLDDSSVLKNTDWRLQLRPPATNLGKYIRGQIKLKIVHLVTILKDPSEIVKVGCVFPMVLVRNSDQITIGKTHPTLLQWVALYFC